MVEEYTDVITGKLYINYIKIMTGNYTSHNYHCKVILDKPANGDVTFIIPLIRSVEKLLLQRLIRLPLP